MEESSPLRYCILIAELLCCQNIRSELQPDGCMPWLSENFGVGTAIDGSKFSQSLVKHENLNLSIASTTKILARALVNWLIDDMCTITGNKLTCTANLFWHTAPVINGIFIQFTFISIFCNTLHPKHIQKKKNVCDFIWGIGALNSSQPPSLNCQTN